LGAIKHRCAGELAAARQFGAETCVADLL